MSAPRPRIRSCRTNWFCACRNNSSCKTPSTGSSRSRSRTKQARPISRGHFKPINSPRYLNDCHEYVFHLTPEGRTPIDRLALGVPYQDKSNIARWGHTDGQRQTLPRQHLVRPYQTIKSRDKQRPHPATFPVQLAGQLHQTPRRLARADDARSVPRDRKFGRRCAGMRRAEIHRLRDRRKISGGRRSVASAAGTRPTPGHPGLREARRRISHRLAGLPQPETPSRVHALRLRITNARL